MNTSSQTKDLLKQQIQNWGLAHKNYNGLNKVITKEFKLTGGAKIKVQFNPERINSSAAKVDAKSIQERPCFLCTKNRPKEQLEISFNRNYLILVNPFPIFPQHLTIPHKNHTNQLIEKHFTSMLDLAKELPFFTIFYNGPKCGASAPDHFHFQAGNKGFMPIEDEFRSGKFISLVHEIKEGQIFKWRNYHRSAISLKSKSKQSLSTIYARLYSVLNDVQKNESEEPMHNILAYFEEESYIIHIFMRALHRPDVFFATGEKQILISPASVDMGGVFITPREEDFKKIAKSDIENILEQVCIDENVVNGIVKRLVEQNKT